LTRVEAVNLKYAQKRAEFVNVLSEDQLKKYDEMTAERRKNGPGGPGGPGGLPM
jgi:hypothetical protein